jgi:hypothetical protein
VKKRKRNDRPRDPVEDWREIMDNRYNPGYWVGGRIHPLIKAGQSEKKPNKYGWVLIPSGMFAIALGASSFRGGGWETISGIWPVLVGTVMVVAGGIMLSRPKQKS